MTVKELKAALATMPDDLIVDIIDQTGTDELVPLVEIENTGAGVVLNANWKS